MMSRFIELEFFSLSRYLQAPNYDVLLTANEYGSYAYYQENFEELNAKRLLFPIRHSQLDCKGLQADGYIV